VQHRASWTLVRWSSSDDTIAALKCRDGRWLRLFFVCQEEDGTQGIHVQLFATRKSLPTVAGWKVSIEPRFRAVSVLVPEAGAVQLAIGSVPPFLLEEAVRKAIARGPTSAKDYLRR